MAIVLLCAVSGSASAGGNVKHGEYLAAAADCIGCHTAPDPGAAFFAGGRPIKTPFGTFYGPNITPHKTRGIGGWSEADFIRAMRYGIRPDGAPYFPAFPYPSYTLITDGDLRDLWAYLSTLPPDATPSRKHDLGIPFGWRFSVRPWQWMFFKSGVFEADPKTSARINRGAYIVRALGHCGECHTPRNLIGVPQQQRYLTGGMGPEGKKIPALTPAHLGKWTDGDLKDFLTTGILPDGDVAGEVMSIVIKYSTSKLTAADLDATIAYIRSLPALPDKHLASR